MTNDLPDAELLERARRGDETAFRRLVERYEAVVAATVIGMLGRGADADDVGQETFIRFYGALDRFREESTLKTYLVRIAMNLSLNALHRRRRGLLRFVSRDDPDRSPPEPAIDPPASTDEEERRIVVRRAIMGLSPKHRAVVVLRMLQSLSTRETAQALGIPEGTVLSRLSRAMKELESMLAPYVRDGTLATEDRS
ncbi:MAG TPA: RNA polymerase sigma factor [Gemmatimonadaceae bacterium]|nr:RNA polymerase sigma factor [Gemmatimonadaceae bacterium]